MLLYISIALITLFILIWLKSPYWALLFFIITKPIVDTSWDHYIGYLSPIGVQGIILPLFYIHTILNPKNIYKKWVRAGWFLFFAMSLGSIFGFFVNDPLAVFETMSKNASVLLAFFLFPYYINTKERLGSLLIAIMIAGLFPIAVSFYQYFTGFKWVERTLEDLVRLDGLYHDSFPVRFYGLYSILAGVMYLMYFTNKKVIRKLVVIALIIGALASVYFVYSRAALAILVSWLVIFNYFSKNKKITITLSVFMVLALPFVVGEKIDKTVEQMFRKEIRIRDGEIQDEKYMMSGRAFVWEEYLDYWVEKQDFVIKLFGEGVNKPTHNEYIRMLLASGAIGLAMFIFFLIRVIIGVTNRRVPGKAFMVALMAMYIIDTVGVTPGEYYYYNIMLFGFLGIFFTNVNIVEDETTRTVTA